MSVAKHRVAAVLVLATGVAVLMAWGRSLGQETGHIREVRDQLRGTWVASTVQSTDRVKAEGAEAAATTIRFDGRSVEFRNPIEGGESRGTFLIDPEAKPPKFDLMLDSGWSIGAYRLEGDTLAVTINPLALPEQLGVPTRGRPTEVRPGLGRFYYVFRKATP